MIIGITSIDLEVWIELVIDAAGIVFKECTGRRIVGEIAHRTGAAERTGQVWWSPDIVGKDLRGHRVEAAQRDHPARKWIPRPGAIRILAGGCGIVERLAGPAEGEVPPQLGRVRRLAGIGLGLLLDQLLIAK